MTIPVKRRSIPVLAVLLVALSAIVVVPAPSAASWQLPRHAMGAYPGWSQANANSFANEVGRPVEALTLFLDRDSWGEMSSSARGLGGLWRDHPALKIISFPMSVQGQSLQLGASGALDGDVERIARVLVDGGLDGSVIRIGWEHNGTWSKWSSLSDPEAYSTYFRRIVDVFRSVSPNFKFEWNVNIRYVNVDLASYPGDAYVDVIGMDIYNSSFGESQRDPVDRWNTYLDRGAGLKWHRDFAAARGKPMAYSEWGLSENHLPGVESDDPYFIRKMLEWIGANNVAYATYFNVNEFKLSKHPNASDQYRQSLASVPGGSNPPPPPPTTAPPTTAPPTTPPPPTTTTLPPTTTAPPTTTTSPPPTTAPAAPPPTTPPAPTTPPPPTTVPRPVTSTPATIKEPPTATTAPAQGPTATPPREQVALSPLRPVPCRASSNPSGAPDPTAAAGYWVLDDSGRVHAVGSVENYGDLEGRGVTAAAIAALPNAQGYWIVDTDGIVYAFGDAKSFGDLRDFALRGPIQTIMASPDGQGYWLIGSDGGVFAFGVPFRGSMGATALNAPVVSGSPSVNSDGYWLVGGDGGVFAFNTPFFGSTGALTLDAPVLSLSPSPEGTGYWLYAGDGGVFSFGVPFQGSMPGLGLCTTLTAVELTASPLGGGYWILTREGFIYGFGDAPELGDVDDRLAGRAAIDMAIAP